MRDLRYDSEEIAKLGQEFMDQFKEKMKKVAEETLGNLYSDLMPHIESDSWCNYRNYLADGLKSDWVKDDFRRDYQRDIRDKILKENKEELIPLLNQDLLKKIESLETQLRHAYERRF